MSGKAVEESLPARITLAYAAEACLSAREGRSVWRMRRRADGEPFLLKLSLEGTEDLEEEFRLLKCLSARLPGAVPAPVDCFREEGTEYLLRSWLPGETLAEYRARQGDCSERRCRELGEKLCRLLETLHGLEPPVIHRDIKPENIVLLPDGGVGLLDFGIARRYKPEQDRDTRHLGTRSTAAPEQYGCAQTDCRTDLYGLGMTLIWLLTGTYDREGLERRTHISRDLRRSLLRAVSFDPGDRYQTASAFSRALTGRAGRRGHILPAAAILGAILLGAGLLLRLPALEKSRPVAFSSLSLERAVRAELALPEGPVTYGDLERVERLAAVGLEPFSREEGFDYRIACYVGGAYREDVPRGDLADLSLLARMPNLREVYLCRQEITDLTPLEGLPLTTLALCGNHITDLTPLAGLTELETLYLGGNPAADWSPLAGLAGLRRLNLDGSVEGAAAPASLAFLNGLTLWELSLGQVFPVDGDWSPLGGQTALETLCLWAPPGEALDAASALPRLRVLKIGDITCPDLTPLDALEGLEVLSIYGGLDRLDGIGELKHLTTLSLGSSAVPDLTPLAGLERLNYLHLTELPIQDFSPLSALPALGTVLVDKEQTAAVEAACPAHAFRLEANP